MKLNKIKKISLSVAIAIILALFVNVGIATFYDSPDYEECFFFRPAPLEGEFEQPTKEEMESSKECQDRNDALRSVFNRNVFTILVITGVISLLIGIYMGVSSVAIGFLFGGILNLFIGVVRFWSDMDEFLRFIILGITLAVLIWIGYKKLK